ncbi:hypothetical protein CRG98_042669 [Punica granatum]|uniref:Reverse transcriptase Ty1/copia-type domain-containing protein n=1 Tax=Punica granatum TaxID=22663 RepID=A0A2I0HZ51_PUNGR|nr:hypothetical protein CRG98_042669 [Punica granatum]
MKDLRPAKQILEMHISHDKLSEKLWLSQEKYIEKILDRFNMGNVKPVSSPLASYLKLSSKQCPTSTKEKEEMKKAKYIVVTESCKEMLWLQNFLQELSLKQERYALHGDSQSAIHLRKNSIFHSRSKRIDIKFHWIRDVLESRLMKLDKVQTDENGADMMTKPLAKEKLHVCRNLASMFEASK